MISPQITTLAKGSDERKCPMKVRLDKWLQVARAFRTRTKATEACKKGKVRVDGATARPHQPVAIAQKIEIDQGQGWTRILKVRQLANRPLPKAQAASLFEDLSPPRPQAGPSFGVFRDRGLGRPTGRDRRILERFRRGE